MDYQLLMRTAICAGEMMLKSGAETYRAEDTMNHILKTSGCSFVEVHATITGIMATVNDTDMEQPVTMISRVKERGTHLYKIVRVNDISRRYCGGEISLEEAYKELQAIEKILYHGYSHSIAMILVVMGFTLMFGGRWMEFAASAFVGIVLALTVQGCEKLGTDAIIQDIVASFVVAVMSLLIRQGIFPKLHMDVVIIGAIMPLVPGVAITNAIRDTLQGDYVSGSARILEAFLKAAAIAIGVGVGMALYKIIL